MPSTDPNVTKQLLQAHAAGQLSTLGLIQSPQSPFQSPGLAEIVDWNLYDNQSIAAGATVPASISLFQTAVGSNSKTNVQTNMSGQGVLPASQAFVLTGVSMAYVPTASYLDIVAFGINSFFQLQVSNKVYLQLPTWLIPGGSVPIRNAVTNQGANLATDALLAGSSSAGTPSRDNVYRFRYPVAFYVQEQFIVSITTPGTAPQLLSATPAVPSVTEDTVGTGLQFTVVLHGILYRNLR